jgi:predicted RNA-binding protein with PUA-like domain
VDLKAVEPLPRPMTLKELRGTRGLEDMVLLRKGSRLSVQPVSAKEWSVVLQAARKPA